MEYKMSNKTKDEIVKALTGKLTEIADAVIKEIKEKPADGDTVEPTKPAEGEKPVVPETPAEPTPGAGETEVTKSISDLSKKVEELIKQLNAKPTAEKTAEELAKKQADIKAGMIELVKSMGIDPENVDVDFVVKEKKKGTVADDENFSKKVSGDDEEDEGDDELTKELNSLDSDQKKEALDHYFKSVIFPGKS